MSESRSERTKARLRYAEVADQCRDTAVIFSNSQLTELFEHTGTALLDFAERAESNRIQGRFFEAMGLIQRQRADMERIFRREIYKGFESLGRLGDPEGRSGHNDANVEGFELSLVEPDEMEESVAAENLVIRANASHSQQLYALGERLTVVNGGRKLKDYEIPAAPHHLVHAFRLSMEGLEVGVRIKVILYALFDKFVIKEARSLYDELNSNLRNAGILPNLKPVHVRHEHSPESMQPHAKQREQRGAWEGAQAESGPRHEVHETDSLGTELFDSIIDLMSARRGAKQGPVSHGQASLTPSERAEFAAVSSDLVAAADLIQHRTALGAVHSMVDEVAQIPNLDVDTTFIEQVKQTLGDERERVLSQIDRDKLSPMDTGLIDLIGMLFEYMLNDPVLPNLAKALLSHLHTPYLKVAIIDRRLLVDARHPARRLLDQMVEAGSLWVDEQDPQRGIFPAMQRVVDRVLREFGSDIALFEELVRFFAQAMNDQQRKTDTMEQRTQEAARGREKLQLAKLRANHQIKVLLQNTALPQPVVSFLNKTWIDRLVFILLRDNDEDRSDDWKHAVQTARDLVALFAAYPGETEPEDLAPMIIDLRKRIAEGVQRMGSYTRSALDPLFALLDDPENWQASTPKTAIAQSAIPIGEAASAMFVANESTLSSRVDISEKEQEVIQRLSKMKFGTWFAFLSDTGGASRRIKLSWLSPLTSTCIFVDRSGVQAEIKTLQELANEILSGRAKVIPRPKHPFIERALVSIRRLLQGPGMALSADEHQTR